MGQASGEQQTIGMVAQTFLSVGPPDTDKSVRATVPYWVGMVAQTFLSVGPPEHRQECLCHRSLLGGNGGTDTPVCGPSRTQTRMSVPPFIGWEWWHRHTCLWACREQRQEIRCHHSELAARLTTKTQRSQRYESQAQTSLCVLCVFVVIQSLPIGAQPPGRKSFGMPYSNFFRPQP
jgi:hypothetical protein